jgi:hypothetical protein
VDEGEAAAAAGDAAGVGEAEGEVAVWVPAVLLSVCANEGDTNRASPPTAVSALLSDLLFVIFHLDPWVRKQLYCKRESPALVFISATS